MYDIIHSDGIRRKINMSNLNTALFCKMSIDVKICNVLSNILNVILSN